MPSFRAILSIGDSKVNPDSSVKKLNQPIDSLGWPASPTSGGTTSVAFNAPNGLLSVNLDGIRLTTKMTKAIGPSPEEVIGSDVKYSNGWAPIENSAVVGTSTMLTTFI